MPIRQPSIRVMCGASNHPLIKLLAVEAGLDADTALAKLVRLYEHVRQHGVAGYLKCSIEEAPGLVENLCLWAGRPLELYSALRVSGWVSQSCSYRLGRGIYLREGPPIEVRSNVDFTRMRVSARRIYFSCLGDQPDYLCCSCRKRFNKSQIHVDHINPLSMGGDNAITNIQGLCQPCNLRKSNHPIQSGVVP